MTVALSGDGADELLAGYDTYRASRWSAWYRRLPWLLRRGLIAPLVDSLPAGTGQYNWPMVARRFVAGAEEPAYRDHASWRRIVPRSLWHDLLTPEFAQADSVDPLAAYAAAADDAPDWAAPLDRQLHMDLTFHLPNDMLVKVDRMSMAHGLEVRVPWLDLEVIEACLALPADCKRRGRHGKVVLRELLSRDLPSTFVRRRKSGFLVPLERWLRNDWQPLLRQTLTEAFCEEAGLFQWPVVRRMLDQHAAGRGDHAYPLFALLVLGLWWSQWLRGTLPREGGPRPAAPVQLVSLGSGAHSP